MLFTAKERGESVDQQLDGQELIFELLLSDSPCTDHDHGVRIYLKIFRSFRIISFQMRYITFEIFGRVFRCIWQIVTFAQCDKFQICVDNRQKYTGIGTAMNSAGAHHSYVAHGITCEAITSLKILTEKCMQIYFFYQYELWVFEIGPMGFVHFPKRPTVECFD